MSAEIEMPLREFKRSSSEEEKNKRLYPSVDLAYPLSTAAYDLAIKRWDAWDGRIQTLFTLAATIALSALVTIHNTLEHAKFGSVWFILALVAFGCGSYFGIMARLKKTLRVIDPKELYGKWLHYSEWEFKKNYIFFSGEHFHLNMAALDKKKRLAVYMLMLFVVGFFFLAIWAIRAAS